VQSDDINPAQSNITS